MSLLANRCSLATEERAMFVYALALTAAFACLLGGLWLTRGQSPTGTAV
jgi:hypothetical protein